MSTEAQSLTAGSPQAKEWIAQNEKLKTRKNHNLAFRKRGSGPPILLLHGFPTWSYDYAGVAVDLETDHTVITLDFLGYGASDKPAPYSYSVGESADSVEDLLAHLTISEIELVVHDYGGIVGQELVDRHLSGKLPFSIKALTILNCGIVYSAYRPTTTQKLLITPVIGRVLASFITAEKTRTLLEGVWGNNKLSNESFQNLWHGIALKDGNKLAYLHIRYNSEREQHHARWEAALRKWEGPLHFIWGMEDPVSGKHVLELAVKEYPRAVVTELKGVGHFPQDEAPAAVAAAIRSPPTSLKASL
jgi:pimeloyl-ACP methyl ester carboxylesterase